MNCDNEAVTAEVVLGERDSQAQRNPYSQLAKSVFTVSAEKLEQGMVDFVGVKLNFPSDFPVKQIKRLSAFD